MRECDHCGAYIHACMGFVNAGDWLNGEENIRELCGVCVFVKEKELFGEQ